METELYLLKKLRGKEFWRVPLRDLDMDKVMRIVYAELPDIKQTPPPKGDK